MSAHVPARNAFSLSSDDGHRDLHSFPTRRSSDLVAIGGSVTIAPASIIKVYGWGNNAGFVVGGGGSLVRSEEHTSELQSRVDIVCRLLLERKKDGTASKAAKGDFPVAIRSWAGAV